MNNPHLLTPYEINEVLNVMNTYDLTDDNIFREQIWVEDFCDSKLIIITLNVDLIDEEWRKYPTRQYISRNFNELSEHHKNLYLICKNYLVSLTEHYHPPSIEINELIFENAVNPIPPYLKFNDNTEYYFAILRDSGCKNIPFVIKQCQLNYFTMILGGSSMEMDE
jgi:hypothetical protein